MQNSGKILVIDDDSDIGNMIKMLLEFKGYTVLVLESPESSKEILYDGTVNVVIMDMLLSGVNGTDICADFKKDSNIAHLPVIMMSAHPDAKKICMEAGADDFFSKPFDLDELLDKVEFYAKK